MHDTKTGTDLQDALDPALADDWFAVAAGSDAVASGPPLRRRLLDREIEVRRDARGALCARITDAASAPCVARDHCGCIFVCLGDAPRPLFALDEFEAPGRRFVYMGAIGVHTGGLRVVENFLDMAHFPFVHAHILGTEEATEVRAYDVELDARGELWARGCKFVQPMASAASEGPADIDYVYRVVNPFSPLLYKAPAGRPGEADIIFLFVQPTQEDACTVHFAISLLDAAHSAGEITAFQQTILGQDKPILENHVYKRLPLDARLEVPSRADAGSSAYRRWLRSIGLRWGVEPMAATAPARLVVEVAAKRKVAEGVASFTLRSPTGGPLPPMTPGAHLDVHLPGGLIRQYSLCNGPDDDGCYTIAVKREEASRGGSAAMHDQVEPGDLLQVGLPKNNFALDSAAGHTLLIAGGIGITPLLAMARHLAARGDDFHLHCFCRSAAHAAFGAELEREFANRWTLHAALSPDATREAIERVLGASDAATHAYTCGPLPLMQLVASVGAAWGWPPERMHFEYFKAARPVAAGGTPFELTLARSGRTVQVPAERSIVEVLRSIDVAIDTNCEQGVCGTCLCTVIDGLPEHRDQYLSAAEKAGNTQMLPCVSRARSATLVLDL
ncbi:Phthalate 4,5-dioxygenase oxygenase reductase subunit [Variovorax sp. PBS-H4]|uniref:2Fe-2S iron-sulfur cluster-binding protein n=1 Tax=Variovorax sp. PBS-H4 TaxID=434008 RepID=UPI001316E0B9|nr:2Fe-2S iron-sulfur cluster-binding protein [Variovorax sp. PBS-H4]VTU38838.1 Phthalate 4,5-dioxygenase oxygenase reductase subunit [Variovorax sp. PBS-H4]